MGHLMLSFCHTRPYLGISAKLKIWDVSACKIGPQSGISIQKVTHPAANPPVPLQTFETEKEEYLSNH
jgi:hypothetical protein